MLITEFTCIWPQPTETFKCQNTSFSQRRLFNKQNSTLLVYIYLMKYLLAIYIYSKLIWLYLRKILRKTWLNFSWRWRTDLFTSTKLWRWAILISLFAHALATDIVSNVISVGFPTSSSNNTSKFPKGFRKERGMWYLQVYTWARSFILFIHFICNKSALILLFVPSDMRWYLQCLRRMSIRSLEGDPISTDVFPVDPNLSFSHASKVHCHWVFPWWSIKCCLFSSSNHSSI